MRELNRNLRAAPTKQTAATIRLLLCALAAHALPAHAQGTAQAVSTSIAEPVREIRHAPHLRTNPTNLERDVVGGLCESEAIRQIAGILQQSETEEMWIFLPRAHVTRQCQWHEIGREERSDADGSYVRVDMAYVKQIIAENDEVHFYHFHPRKYFECASQDDCRRQSASAQSGDFDQRWITDLLYSMPSPSDVHFMMDLTSRFHRRHQGRGTIKHMLVTPYGVVDYELTDKGLAKFDAERHGRSEGLYITWVTASALADDRLQRIAQDRAGGIAQAVRRLAQTLNSEYLRVQFRTLEAQVGRAARAPE